MEKKNLKMWGGSKGPYRIVKKKVAKKKNLKMWTGSSPLKVVKRSVK